MSDAQNARKLRRRHMHERQAVIFGLLIALLALIFVVAAAVYTGNLNLSFMNRGFSAVPSPTASINPQPCPPAGALPVAASHITVNVYNGSNISGFAKSTGTSLTSLGFKVGVIDNAPPFTGTARITFGVNGIAQAYTLAAYTVNPVFQLDTRQDTSVDITLGQQFGLKSAAQVKLNPKKPFAAPPGCVPYASIPLPTTTVPTTVTPTPAAAG
ncbi:MAG: LytR C-terminal domain-containing protein [Micrococcales bacterium]|nr:LytR C-terminal domain-containing protein [Micrococcales bacterium]